MNRHAKLPSMHIDNCWFNLGELCMILTVHGSDHTKSKCIKWLQQGQADSRLAKSRMWLSCILSYLAPYLQHTEGVHQSIIIIINHYFPPPKKCSNYLIQYTLSWGPLEIQNNVAQCKGRGRFFWQSICYHVAAYTIMWEVDFWPTPHRQIHKKVRPRLTN